MYLLAIDIGSSGPKAALYAPSGEQRSIATIEYQPHPASSVYELPATELWHALVTVLHQLPDTERRQVVAISISSHGESFVPVDLNGSPLGPFLLNLDLRATEEAEELALRFGRDMLYRLTGLPAHAMYPLPKIAWLRRHQPSLFVKAAQFLCVEDYLLRRIGVGAYISESLASRTFGFDLHSGQWSAELLEAAGISSEQLAAPVVSGTPLGHADAASAAELGLPTDALWIAGGHDQACCSLGSGGLRPSVAVDGTGTFECVTIAHRERHALAGGFPTERHVLPDTFLTLAYTPAGIVPQWLRSLADADVQPQSYAKLFADLPAEPTSLLFYPYLVGTGTPHLDAEARGAILGLTTATTQPELYKAALEGITFEMLANLESLDLTGLSFNRIHAVGGGARSDTWLQLKSDIFGRDIVAIHGEASCIGASICAGLGAGIFTDWQQGADALVHERRIFSPNAHRHARYREIFAQYKYFAGRIYDFSHTAQRREVLL